MKKALLVAFMVVGLAGCQDGWDSGWGFSKPQYVKDPRTGFCFAEAGYGAAHVPCTPEVEELIAR